MKRVAFWQFHSHREFIWGKLKMTEQVHQRTFFHFLIWVERHFPESLLGSKNFILGSEINTEMVFWCDLREEQTLGNFLLRIGPLKTKRIYFDWMSEIPKKRQRKSIFFVQLKTKRLTEIFWKWAQFKEFRS